MTYSLTRSGKDRRIGKDRRSRKIRREQRRRRVRPVTSERRGGQDRRAGERRSDQPRRSGRDRRAERLAAALPTRDRERAHALADEFAGAIGAAEARLAKLVRHKWPIMPLPVRGGIVEELLPLLQPLAGGKAPVTEELRTACEEVVAKWIGRFRR
jgi:hypothetical protein